ncbi:methyltransferase type 12 [Natranaerobius trueperi]|uniref:Methyltransferase type 12 n=1 Tax=Natranaerobius trueperi TaxID=759412 RepID=A0A226C356_9FIRM|nr:methyltransferase type 12 [Natranaerobius trueperi]
MCYSSAYPFQDEKFQHTYYYCQNCEFIFLDEKHIVSSKKEVEVYERHDNNFQNKGYVKMFERFIESNIKPFEDKLKTALDFGCGPGPVLAEMLRQRGIEVDIYDLYFYPEKVYEHKSYDLITSTEVFEHLEDPVKTTKLLKTHLNHGGYLAIMTRFHPRSTIEFNKWFYRIDPTHIAFYQPKTFEVIADKLGMKLVQYDSTDSLVLKKI